MRTIRYLLLGLILASGVALAGGGVAGCGDDRRPANPDGRADGGAPGDGGMGVVDFQGFTKELILTQTAENNEPVDFIDRQFTDSMDPAFFDDLFQ